MKMQKQCDEKPVELPFLRDIKAGTIFRYNSLNEGPYLKVFGGIVNLMDNVFYADNPNAPRLIAYQELTKAYLVTGE